MSLLGKIIFIADYIEPNRKIIPGLDEIRKYAFEDIDKAVCTKITNMSAYLLSNNIFSFNSNKLNLPVNPAK